MNNKDINSNDNFNVKDKNNKDINNEDINHKYKNRKDLNDIDKNYKEENDTNMNNKDINNYKMKDIKMNDVDINIKDFNNKKMNNIDFNSKDLNNININNKDTTDKNIKDINMDNKDASNTNNIPSNYNHIIEEINSGYSTKLNINNNLDKTNKGKSSILSKLKNNELDIKINKIFSKNNNIIPNSKDNNYNNENLNNTDNDIESPILSNSLDNNSNGSNSLEKEKGEKIEQNIDRIFTKNKIFYLENLINQKIEKEKELSNILNNKDLLLKYYLYKWKNGNDIDFFNKYKDNNLAKNNAKSIMRRYVIINWNKELKEFYDIYNKNKPYIKLFNLYKDIFIRRPFDIMKENYYSSKINKDTEGIPDLSYIRNKLHISIVKRVKVTKEEMKKYNDSINKIFYLIKRNIFRYFINLYKKNKI